MGRELSLCSQIMSLASFSVVLSGAVILGDRHSGVAVFLLQRQHIRQGGVGGQVGVAADEAGLVVFHTGHHDRLALHRLGAIDKGDAALLGQGDGHGVVGHFTKGVRRDTLVGTHSGDV